MDDYFTRLVLLCIGIGILSFVTLFELGIGVYIGDSVIISLCTGIIGYMYKNALKMQQLDDNITALGNRLDTIERRIFK